MSDWHVIRILVPILLPFAFLALLILFGLLGKNHPNPWVAAIGAGQLCWVGLGMAVDALYEQRHSHGISLSIAIEDAVFWALIMIMVLQTAVAATAPIISRSRSPTSGGRRILNQRRALVASVVLTAAAAMLYILVHATRQSCL